MLIELPDRFNELHQYFNQSKIPLFIPLLKTGIAS